MHWMLDWELKKLIREGMPSEGGLECPQCKTPIQFARQLKWIRVATEAPERRRRAAVRIQALVRMRQVRERVRALQGREQVPGAHPRPQQEKAQMPIWLPMDVSCG